MERGIELREDKRGNDFLHSSPNSIMPLSLRLREASLRDASVVQFVKIAHVDTMRGDLI